MNFSWQAFIRAWVPPLLRQRARHWLRPRVYTGDYRTWADARAASGGYDDSAILEKAIEAARAVRDGHAAWERDTVLFSEPEVHWPLLASLLRAAAADGRLDLVDFGGAFGSIWWQHRRWLEGIETRWHVVEQTPFVAAGRREFEVGPLCFHENLDACCVSGRPSTILLSSVLPYLESPHAFLTDVASRGFRHIIIDRTGFVQRGSDRLTIQRVPSSIYEASYPSWLFNRAGLLRPFELAYRIVDEWATFDEPPPGAEFRGMLLERTIS